MSCSERSIWAIPAERPSILRPARAVAAVRRDEFDTTVRELRIELVGESLRKRRSPELQTMPA